MRAHRPLDRVKMPTEKRIIRFATEELVWALIEYSRRGGISVWHDQFKRVELSSGEPVHARLDLNGHQPINYDASEIAAALIFFCIQRSIPLPKKADKNLVVEDDKVALTLDSEIAATRLQFP